MRNCVLRILVILPLVLSTGCSTYMARLIDEAKSFSHYVTNKRKSLWVTDSESRLVASKQEFYGQAEEEFIPLNDSDGNIKTILQLVAQPKEVPGNPESSIPSIDSFKAPDRDLTSIFHKIYFQTDQYTPKEKDEYKSLERMATYLKRHKNTYIFIEGHCDERASEAYNLSLGTRRANYIRNVLIKYGVNPQQIYTTSYGKERPEELGHGQKVWAKNRRVAFKIYNK